MCLLIVRVQRSSPRQHASIHPCLVSLLFIPSLYSSFNSKDISFTCLLCCTLHIKFYALRNILPGAIYCHLLCLCHVVGIVLCMYASFHCYNCYYSRTSEQRTLWERVFCPLFGGCPYLGGLLYFDIIIMSTMLKLLWMNFMLSVSESNSHVVLSVLLMHA